MEQQQQELTADTALGKFNFKGSSLNTLATVATLIVACLVAFIVYGHSGDSKDTNRELVSAIKEMAQASREQNCLMRFDMRERAERADFCKQISR